MHFKHLKTVLQPLVLKQADGTKPYIIRTDASNYALGAVLLQGEGSDLHFSKRGRPPKVTYRHHKIKMFQARRLLQQQFPAEPSILNKSYYYKQLIMSPPCGTPSIYRGRL
ncbi:hypothetical protein TNCV_562291 [Trichonephila clavipes]|nr:hypothetical protein TNCV_562291 [Trichonephila clavipes]